MLVAIIWGTTFIAQKVAGHGLGPFGFVGMRFLLSFMVVLPFAIKETMRQPIPKIVPILPLVLLSAVFSAGVLLQQIGTLNTSVTSAGFLTGLYVIIVPLAELLLFRKMPRAIIWLACLLSVIGVWLLNGATLVDVSQGDLYIIACAICFGVQVPFIGHLINRHGHPICFALTQYAVCSAIALTVAVSHEQLHWQAVIDNIWPLLYAGVVSGGIAYTLQGVAQQYADSSKAAIIMSSEALFAAIAGVAILNERLDAIGWIGCAVIFMAMCLTELPAVQLFKRG